MATQVTNKTEPQDITLNFPAAGIDLSRAYCKQPARKVSETRYARTTPEGLNVCGYEPTSDRLRGGTRPGLVRYIDAQVAGEEWVVQHLNTVVSTGTPGSGGAMQTSQSGRVVTLVAVAQGNVKYANPGDTSWSSATNGTIETPPLNYTGIIYSASQANVDGEATLWFADGTNWCYFQPSNNTVYTWTQSAGELPTDAGNNAPRLIETWQGRIVLSGLVDDPQTIFMTRQGDPTDFFYISGTPTDPSQAVKLSAGSGFGVVGDVVTALIPYSDDMLIIGMDSKIAVLRGNPADGGNIDLLTNAIGVAFGRAWCMDPYGFIWFVSNKTGIYRMFPGQQPQRVSQPIEQLVAAINTGENAISLIWDDRLQAPWIFITFLEYPSVTVHLLVEQRSNAWWPVQFADPDFNPLVVCTFDGNEPGDRVALIGSFDGYVRALSHSATTDDGRNISSSVVIGPIVSATLDDILLRDLQSVLSDDSGDVTFDILAGPTGQSALASEPALSGTWRAGRNENTFCMVADHVIYVRITATTSWALEQIRARVESKGIIRARSAS